MPSGRMKTGRTTMQDIADRLHISKVSVSKALNKQKGVSDELRDRIFSAAQDMGYLTEKQTENAFHFAFVVSKHFFLETDAFYSEMYYYFNKYCVSAGYSTTLLIVNGSDEAGAALPTQLMQESFDGIAVAGELSRQFLVRLSQLGLPMVLMDFESEETPCDAILTDNYYWGFHATQYLIQKGHTHIGFVGEVGATASITDRFYGYRRALTLNNLPYQPEWTLVNNDVGSGLYQLKIQLPERLPTAFVCHCDMAAHYLIDTLSGCGLTCPEDVSLVSFDNTRLAETNEPPLTSVNVDIRLFARRAIETLCTHLQKGEAGAPSRIYLPSQLVERESVRTL